MIVAIVPANWPDFYTRAIHRKNDDTDAVTLGVLRSGPYQSVHPVGMLGLGGPDLVTVNDQIFAIPDSSGT